MTDKKDETGKAGANAGKPAAASDPAAAKRPHAVIDLKATEVVVNKPAEAAKSDASAKDGGKDGKAAPAAATMGAAAGAAAGTTPPPSATAAKSGEPKTSSPSAAAKPIDGAAKSGSTAASAAAVQPSAKRSGGFASHLVAGVVGGALALLGGQAAGPMLGIDLAGTPQPPPELVKRLAALEQAQSQRPASAGTDVQKLAAAESRIAKLEEAASVLANSQARSAGETKALDEKFAAMGGTADAGQRLGKLEEQFKALTDAATSDPKNAGRLPQLAQLTSKIGDIETALVTRTAGVRKEIGQEVEQRLTQAGEQAEAARARLAARTQTIEQSLKSVNEETTALRTSVDALKSDVDSKLKLTAKPADVQAAVAPIATKISALEQNVQGVVKSEQDRNATAGNILLSLELANLKRALDRGGKYASELAAVKKLAGGKLDLAVLEAQQNAGVPSAQMLATELRNLAHAMLDAEAEPADATVTDRMLSGFKSIVRVRKTNFSADDKGTEATIARMEKALTESRLADVLEEAKKLTAKAAAPAQNWLQRIDSRYQVDKALAALEASLKTSLAGGAAPAKGN